MNHQEYRQTISDHIQKHGSIQQVAGMLVYCIGYIESVERRTDGWGWETKLLGIEAKFKGKVDNELIDVSTMVKRILMEWLRFFSKIWFLAPFVWLKRKDLIFSIIQLLRCEVIRNAQKKMKYADFSPFCGELLKKGQAMAKKEDYKEIIYWMVFSLEFDNCYRMIFQDTFGEINIERIKEFPTKELVRIANLTIKRNRGNMGNKWTILWTFIKVAALFKKPREAMVKFILSLDMSKIIMDEDDRYWTLRYDVYSFAGRTFDDRFREVKRIDEEKGNFIICDHPEEEKKETGSHFSDKPVVYKTNESKNPKNPE